MKAMRYILSLIAILSVVNLCAATYGTPYQPQNHRQAYITQTGTPAPSIPMSTLNAPMMKSGSALPMAAVTGTKTANDYAPAGPNRAKKGEEEGDTPPSDPQGPMEDPLGDAALPLFLLACVYVCARAFLRRKRA